MHSLERGKQGLGQKVVPEPLRDPERVKCFCRLCSTVLTVDRLGTPVYTAAAERARLLLGLLSVAQALSQP